MKIVLMPLILLFAFLLVAPAMAEPKESKYFYLYIKGVNVVSGYIDVSPEWKDVNLPALPPDGPAVIHIKNCPNFLVLNVYVVIGEGSNQLTIPKSFLTYLCVLDMNLNRLTNRSEMKLQETVHIFTDSAKTKLLGALELNTWRNSEAGELGVTGAFEGHGTGGLDGVKLKGDHVTTGVPNEHVREGVIIGWPLDVTVWPPA